MIGVHPVLDILDRLLDDEGEVDSIREEVPDDL